MVADLYREQLQMAGVAAENGDHLLPLLLQLVQGTDSRVVPQTSSISIPSEPLKCKPQDGPQTYAIRHCGGERPRNLHFTSFPGDSDAR